MDDAALPCVDADRLPPVLYVPCVRHVADVEDIEFSYRETSDGRLAFLAYTALDRLRDGAGEDQPWVMLPLPAVRALHAERPWDLMVLDLHIPEDKRQAAR